MPQLNKGDTFADGQQVTGARLNQLVDSATLLPGAITDQSAVTANDIQATDGLLIYDDSATSLKKATVGDVLGANLPITASQVNAATGKDVIVTPSAGSSNTTIAYSATVASDVTTVSVSHVAHGLVKDQHITVSSATNTNLNGSHVIDSVPTANSFTFKIQGNMTAGSGTLTYLKSSTLLAYGNISTANNVSVGGIVSATSGVFVGTSSIKLPAGTTAQRPSIGAIGMLRFNTTTTKAEIYDGTEWKEVGGNPFEASGGNIVLGPEKTTTAATFSSDGSIVTVTNGSGHTVQEGQVIEIISSSTGYTQFEAVAYDITAFTFKLSLKPQTLAVVSNISCTYRKSGRHRIHIFTGSGTFSVSATSPASIAEVLIIGGGGGSVYNGSISFNGPKGGVAHIQTVKLQPNTSYSISVGSAGVSVYGSGVTATNGGNSSAFGYIAYGGEGSNNSGTDYVGASGGNNIGDSGNSRAIGGSLYLATTVPTAYDYAISYQSEITNIQKSFAKYGRDFQSSGEVKNPLYGEGGSSKKFTPKGVTDGGAGVVIIKYPYAAQ